MFPVMEGGIEEAQAGLHPGGWGEPLVVQRVEGHRRDPVVSGLLVSRLLSTARHLLEMYRRQLDPTHPQLKIRRLINRPAKVGHDLARFALARK